ncbi:MAG: biotin-dependent carboxyltransferase family protein [Thermodesulfobacteriota bacterium]
MQDNVFLVLDPGPFSTVQDLGRFGYQSLGVPISGALDPYSAQVANLLAGNSPRAAVLEMSIRGCTLAVLQHTRLALTGAQAMARLNSKDKATWSAFEAEPGDVLRISQVSQGCRIYLAVRGGLDLPLIMGSRSTYVQAALGGLQGRALQKGDFLPAGSSWVLPKQDFIPEEYRPELSPEINLGCVPGPQEQHFQQEGQALYESCYTVTQRADRRGIRLEGPQLLHAHDSPGSIVSEPILPGNIQVPGDGQPIALLNEQTVGGYPKIATVQSSDLHKLGQAIPGDKVHFSKITFKQAKQNRQNLQKSLQDLQRILGFPVQP